jgi:hypothetical protein
MSQYGSPPRQFEEIVDSLKAHVNSGESWETVQQEFTRFARQYASSIMKDWAASIDLATLHKSPVQTKDFNPASQPQSRKPGGSYKMGRVPELRTMVNKYAPAPITQFRSAKPSRPCYGVSSAFAPARPKHTPARSVEVGCVEVGPLGDIPISMIRMAPTMDSPCNVAEAAPKKGASQPPMSEVFAAAYPWANATSPIPLMRHLVASGVTNDGLDAEEGIRPPSPVPSVSSTLSSAISSSSLVSIPSHDDSISAVEWVVVNSTAKPRPFQRFKAFAKKIFSTNK